MIVVINTQTLGVSEYNLDWSDLVVDDDGAVCGLAGEDETAGLYALDDEVDDEGNGEAVAPVVATGLMGFGAATPKTAERAYVTSAGAGYLSMVVTASGSRMSGARSVEYGLSGLSDADEVERTVRLGRGVEGQRLAVRLEPWPGVAWRLGGLALRVRPRARNR
jgi:hypothetical protein